MKQRLVLIIGAMKSGTTSLFNHLAAHPHVAGCNPKEPGFFAFEDKFNRGAKWYESLFDLDPKLHQFALDGSTDYSKYPHCGDVPERIEQYDSNTKMLYLMRHPLRRIESHARHVQFTGRELGQIDSGRKNHSLDCGISSISLDISRYAAQIDQYRAEFDDGRVKLLVLEEITEHPRASLAAVCKFIGIDEALLPDTFEKHNRGSKIRRRRHAGPLWRAARSIKPVRAFARTAIPAGLRGELRTRAGKIVKVEGRFTLSASEEDELLNALSGDLSRLRDTYGVDIERHWGISI